MEKSFKIEVINSIKRLPTLPIIFQKVLETIDDPRSSAKILEEIIKNDQSISAKVLSMSNSAFYGYSKSVTDITRAIVILGFDMVKNIALSVSVFGMFSSSGTDTTFDRNKFWLHSIGCGYLGKIMAENLRFPDADKAFIACLLHDIGKVVLSSHFEEDFMDAIYLMETKNISLREAETRIFGFDHAEVGYWLADKWDFPVELEQAIKNHHNPERSNARHSKLTFITHAANLMIQEAKIGTGGKSTQDFIHDRTKNEINLTAKAQTKCIEEMKGIQEKLEVLLQIMS